MSIFDYPRQLEEMNRALMAQLAAAQAELAKFQESPFHPDWSLLEATRKSLREHMGLLKAAQEELSATKESSVTQPKCGRCGKHQIADIHTCTPTAWARKMEEELAKLKTDKRDKAAIIEHRDSLMLDNLELVEELSSVKAENVKLRNLYSYINGADIRAADMPHIVVEKLQKAIDAARKDKR